MVHCDLSAAASFVLPVAHKPNGVIILINDNSYPYSSILTTTSDNPQHAVTGIHVGTYHGHVLTGYTCVERRV